MATLEEDLNGIKTVEDTITRNKVANFAYTDEAYTGNDADGVEVYDVNNAQNIPVPDADILKVNSTVLTKGYRAQASSITRMLVNHFFGRVSYNLNKVNDNMSSLVATLKSHLGTANGFASLDASGRIPYSQLPESSIEFKGTWDASTNTPALHDGTGTTGDTYIVNVAGTQDLGSGSIQFFVNDRIIYSDGKWTRLSAGDVKTVNNIQPVNGNITLEKGDIGLRNVPNVTTNGQTPTYSVETSLTELSSGERLDTAFGKISKAVIDFIAHNSDTSNPHAVTAEQVGLGNVTNVSTTDLMTQGSTSNMSSGGLYSYLHGIKFFNSIGQLGMEAPTTTKLTYDNMPNFSMLLISTDSVTDAPGGDDYVGTITMCKWTAQRGLIHSHTRYGAGHDYFMYLTTEGGATGEWVQAVTDVLKVDDHRPISSFGVAQFRFIYGVCSDDADIQEKTVELTNVAPDAFGVGTTFKVMFTNGSTYLYPATGERQSWGQCDGLQGETTTAYATENFIREANSAKLRIKFSDGTYSQAYPITVNGQFAGEGFADARSVHTLTLVANTDPEITAQYLFEDETATNIFINRTRNYSKARDGLIEQRGVNSNVTTTWSSSSGASGYMIVTLPVPYTNTSYNAIISTKGNAWYNWTSINYGNATYQKIDRFQVQLGKDSGSTSLSGACWKTEGF